MSTATAEKLPFFLRDNYAPVAGEQTCLDLSVDGAIPPALIGTYLRTGPNPKNEPPRDWFFGDGMLHGVRLESGRARWYRNRWVQTEHLGERVQYVRPDGTRKLSAGLANTNVIRHAGRILALSETTFPYEVGSELETKGVYDFAGRLTTGMTAHPKICPVTGEMHFFDYNWFAPFLTYHCADASGTLVRSEAIDVPGATMIHDFAITRNHIVFMDLPVVFNVERALRGIMPFRWDDAYGARVGLMPRSGGNADIRWFEVEPCYVFHPMNAFERDGRVIVDVARYPQLWRGDAVRFDTAALHRWELDPASGAVTESARDDRPIEFPRIDDRRTGLPARHGFAVRNVSSVDAAATALVKYDLETGAGTDHDFGPGRFPGEGVFAPDPTCDGDDEGWVLAYVYDQSRGGSDLVILDAKDFAAPAVATVRLPGRVPFGFHGNWMAD